MMRQSVVKIRSQNIQNIIDNEYDVIIIGGGATGFGVALDSIYKGYKTLLLEREDFAKATSSRSTKILHGGVRYLAQGNIHLVYEALHEKMLIYKNAPHLARSLDFIIPCKNLFYQGFYGMGMKAYDILGGFKCKYLSKLIGKKSFQERLPLIKDNNIASGVIYDDGQFDDARYIISLMKTLDNLGGKSLNYAEVIDFIKENNIAKGVKIKDKITGETFEIKARCIFNATGIFSDNIKFLDTKEKISSITFSQGVHIVADSKIYQSQDAMLVPKTSDGRVLFFIPWKDKVIIGTTDTQVQEAKSEPVALREEIDFILNNANEYLKEKIKLQDITSVYAGIRPLAKSSEDSSSISREEVISISESGVISVIGGKWTTYRKMGSKLMNFAVKHNKLAKVNKSTKKLQLMDFLSKEELDLIPSEYKVYGSEYRKQIKNMEGLEEKIHPKLDITRAMIEYAILYEKAYKVEDILARRTRSLFLDYQSTMEILEKVADIMKDILQESDSWKNNEIKEFKEMSKSYDINSYF